MARPKMYISINGVINKLTQTEFTEKEFDTIIDEIIEVVEKYDCAFGGGFAHQTEEECCKMLDNE